MNALLTIEVRHVRILTDQAGFVSALRGRFDIVDRVGGGVTVSPSTRCKPSGDAAIRQLRGSGVESRRDR